MQHDIPTFDAQNHIPTFDAESPLSQEASSNTPRTEIPRSNAPRAKILTFNPEEESLSEKASASPRGRALHFFNIDGLPLHGEQSPLQAFVNCINRSSYVPPHKHENYHRTNSTSTYTYDLINLLKLAAPYFMLAKNKGKQISNEGEQTSEAISLEVERWELFIILKGKAKIITFSPDGNADDIVFLSKDDASIAVIPSNIYHSVVALEEDTELFELKNGRYDAKNDKKIAPWAPDENENESASFRDWLEVAQKDQNARNYKEHIKKPEECTEIPEENTNNNGPLNPSCLFMSRKPTSPENVSSTMGWLKSTFCCG